MSEPIDFYFDFSSPYGYFASHRVDELGSRHGREVRWHPYLMGAVFKITGRKPLAEHPLILDYAVRDLVRTARLLEIPYNHPEMFPIASVAPCRAYYWLLEGQGHGPARAFARAVYQAYMVHGRNISDPGTVLDIASGCGVDKTALETALSDQSVKDRLRQVNDDAVGRQVFGSPYLIVDGEPFWGNDRLEQAERWLETGGW